MGGASGNSWARVLQWADGQDGFALALAMERLGRASFFLVLIPSYQAVSRQTSKQASGLDNGADNNFAVGIDIIYFRELQGQVSIITRRLLKDTKLNPPL